MNFSNKYVAAARWTGERVIRAHDVRQAALFLAACRGKFDVREAYDWFLVRHPALRVGHPNWRWKVRVALRRAAIAEIQVVVPPVRA